jgi:TRAP-type C4-dicarboxylate transport system substrate-binding protein
MASESAREPVMRIASLVPRNSVYHQQLLQLGQAWRKALDGKGRFNVFTDGSQGGEAEMVKRIRIGQLQGGLLSVVGLREIDESVTAMQSIPLLFRDWAEVDYVRDKLRDSMERRFLAKGFVVLAWGDAGWVRFFSKSAASKPEDFRGLKFFTWGNEPEQQTIMKDLGYFPVPLETADILPAIQTGMVSVVPSTPYFAMATQVFSSAPHMLELNWAPIVGAIVLSRKAFESMPPEVQLALKQSGEQIGPIVRARARAEVDEAVAAMVKRGLIVTKPSNQDLKQWESLAEQLYPRIRGKLVPSELFDEVLAHVKTFRSMRR